MDIDMVVNSKSQKQVIIDNNKGMLSRWCKDGRVILKQMGLKWLLLESLTTLIIPINECYYSVLHSALTPHSRV